MELDQQNFLHISNSWDRLFIFQIELNKHVCQQLSSDIHNKYFSGVRQFSKFKLIQYGAVFCKHP